MKGLVKTRGVDGMELAGDEVHVYKTPVLSLSHNHTHGFLIVHVVYDSSMFSCIAVLSSIYVQLIVETWFHTR